MKKNQILSIIYLFVFLTFFSSCSILNQKCYNKIRYIGISEEEFRNNIITVIDNKDRENKPIDELKLQITVKIYKDTSLNIEVLSPFAYLTNISKYPRFVCLKWVDFVVTHNFALTFHVLLEDNFSHIQHMNTRISNIFLLPNKQKQVGGAGIHFQGLVGLNKQDEHSFRSDYINTNYGTYKVIATYITPNGNVLYSNIIEVEYDSDGLRIINSPEVLK